MKSWSRNHASRAFIHFLPLLKKVTLWVRQFIAKYSAKITFIRLFRYLFCCFSGKIESFQCFTVIPIGYCIFTAQKMKFPINPNLGVLFRGSFWGGGGWMGGGRMGVKITPHPRQRVGAGGLKLPPPLSTQIRVKNFFSKCDQILNGKFNQFGQMVECSFKN